MLKRTTGVLLFLAFAFPVFSQTVSWSDLQKNIDSWIQGPASLLVTDQEKAVYKKLKTPEEKMQFIKIFWQRRDPILRTSENEFKDEFYSRVDYVNKTFAEDKVPGWKTSRGQVYVLFGPPSRVNQQSMPNSSRPAQLWVYDKAPSKELPPNEALMFLYHDFKYVLAPPNPQPGDTIGRQQQEQDRNFRYQTIPSKISMAFAEVRKSDVIDEKKNYDSLIYSVKSTEKFQIAEIDFDIKVNADHQPQVTIGKAIAPVYDDGSSVFAELYFKQELKQGDTVVASGDSTATYHWSSKEFGDLQNISETLKKLDAPAGQYELWVTVQDRISMVSESKKIPVTY